MDDNRIAEKLVENIRRICREKGISMMQMESDLGFSSGLVSRWNKTKTCPSFDKVVDIMGYLDITYDELMGNAKYSSSKKQERPVGDEIKNSRVIEQLRKGSISGAIKWEKAGEDIPFEVDADIVFQSMLKYDLHRIYYTSYKEGWFLLSLQYGEETVDALAAVYMLPAVGKDMVKLDVPGKSAVKLLKMIDEETFNRIKQDQADEMKEDFLEDFLNEDFLGEEFQGRQRNVS